eukprot:gene1711-480_t
MTEEKKQNEDFTEKLKLLAQKQENKHCCDCLNKDTSFANVVLGNFLCTQCSSVHRSLGKMAMVKSITLDNWSEKEYKLMKGNVEVNTFWETNLFPFEKPLGNDPLFIRKHFIQQKYLKKKFRSDTFSRDFSTSVLYMKGYIQKQCEDKINWKKRYIVVIEDKIVVFKQKGDALPEEVFNLDVESMVTCLDPKEKTRILFNLTSISGAYTYLCADNTDTALNWIMSLRADIYYLNLRQIYLDPRNFLKSEIENTVTKSGFLSKKGKGSFNLTKKKRFFILKNGQLAYYKDQKAADPIQSIDLKDCVIEKEEGTAFALTNYERCFSVHAENEKDLNSWFKAIEESIFFASERKVIEEKSLAIHNLVLSKLLRQLSKEDTKNIASLPHSPFAWNHPSFYQSYGLQQSTSLKRNDSKRKSLGHFKKVSLVDFKRVAEEEENERREEDLQNTTSKLLKINARRSVTPIVKKRQEEEEEDDANDGQVKIVMSEEPLNATLKGKGKTMLMPLKKKNGSFNHDSPIPTDRDNEDKPKFEHVLNNIVDKKPKLPNSLAPDTIDSPVNTRSPSIYSLPDSMTGNNRKSLREKSILGNDLNSLLNSSSNKHKSLGSEKKEKKTKIIVSSNTQ